MPPIAWDRTILTVGAIVVGALALQELWASMVAALAAYVAAAILLTDPRLDGVESKPREQVLQDRRART